MLSFNMLLEAAVAAQGCHVGIRYLCVLDAAGDGWKICIVVWQMVSYFEVSFVRSSEDNDAVVNAGPMECRVLHKGNSSPME